MVTKKRILAMVFALMGALGGLNLVAQAETDIFGNPIPPRPLGIQTTMLAVKVTQSDGRRAAGYTVEFYLPSPQRVNVQTTDFYGLAWTTMAKVEAPLQRLIMADVVYYVIGSADRQTMTVSLDRNDPVGATTSVTLPAGALQTPLNPS